MANAARTTAAEGWIKMQRKTYLINGKKFLLKEDFTIEECEEIQKLMEQIYESGSGNSTAIYSFGGIKKFLSKSLSPAEEIKAGDETDFGKAAESVALEVIKDFFLRRLRLTNSTAEYFKALMKEFGTPQAE